MDQRRKFVSIVTLIGDIESPNQKTIIRLRLKDPKIS
jgi:hypothetical protein